jgi:hypothetical protein
MNPKGLLLSNQISLFAADAAALNHVQSTLARASRPRVRQSRGCHLFCDGSTRLRYADAQSSK